MVADQWYAALSFVVERTTSVVLAKGVSTQQTAIGCYDIVLSLSRETLPSEDWCQYSGQQCEGGQLTSPWGTRESSAKCPTWDGNVAAYCAARYVPLDSSVIFLSASKSIC